MGRFVVNGGVALDGKVKIESAKNSVLPMMSASLLTKDKVIIRNCPKIEDVYSMQKILTSIGVNAFFDGEDMVIDSRNLNKTSIDKSLSTLMRSSVFLMSSLLVREGVAELYFPGGCSIGKRPIDIHVKALEKLGASVLICDDLIRCSANSLVGKSVWLDFPSVGATENLMMAAVLAKGKTEIHNPAREPEIVDLMNFLNSMGAKVYGAGTSTILIDGVQKLHGTEYLPICDRIEAGTYMLAAAITGGKVEIEGRMLKNICTLVHKLCENTCKITIKNDIIYLKSERVRKSFSFYTAPHPSFPTDLQAQTMALLTVSQGSSVVTENVFENRFGHVKEFLKMGANIRVKGKNAFIEGVNRLHGATVTANDLRGGAALVLAGLNAEGVTTVCDTIHIQRGYFDMVGKLSNLGANIIST